MNVLEIKEDIKKVFVEVFKNELLFIVILVYFYGKFFWKNFEKEVFFNYLKENNFKYGLCIGNWVNCFLFKNLFEINRIDVKGEYLLKKF